MSEVVSVEEDDGGSRGLGLYPIRTVSRLTGVPPVTLRAWERRYRLLTPTRTEKGHRLYTEADIERVRQVLALMDRGNPASHCREASLRPAQLWPIHRRSLANRGFLQFMVGQLMRIRRVARRMDPPGQR